MTTRQPVLYEKDGAALRAQITDHLRAQLNWQGQKDGAGQGLVQLFGRLAEIIIERLNRVPEQHFLAFLNEGGIDQLAPRAASTEIAFLAEKDGRPAILVPARTQVATRPAGEQAEVIFETVRDMQVIATGLARCITVDQRTCADHTAQANAQSTGSFAAFQGDTLRERWLYLGHDTLLAFPDAAVRAETTITLHVALESASSQGNWQLDWRFWDGEQWASLPTSGARVQDETANLRQSGEIHFSKLPEMKKTKVNDVESCWLACQLTPLDQPLTLPTIRDIGIARQIDVPAQPVTIDAALTGTQAGAAFAPVNPGDAFYPFGQRPAFLDGFYLRVDDACTKPGATVELKMLLQGIPSAPNDASELEKLTLDWEYFSRKGWTLLGRSRWGCPALEFLDTNDPLIINVDVVARDSATSVLEIDLPADYASELPPPSLPGGTLRFRPWTAYPYVELPLPAGCEQLPQNIVERGRGYTPERLNFRDTTCALTISGPGIVSFTVPLANGTDPPFAPAEVNGQTGLWIRARITDGSYDVPRPKTSGLLSRLLIGNLPPLPPEPYPPLVQALEVRYTDYKVVDLPRPLQHRWSQADQRWRDHSDGQPFAPFTTLVEHRALYLGFNPLDPDPARGRVAFPPDTWIELYFDLEEASDEVSWSGVLWEYWDGAQWQTLVTVDETAGLQRGGYVGFFGPKNHQPASEFGRRAWWLRVSPQEAQAQPGQTRSADTWMPRVRAIRLNTIHAINAETIAGELLGSSTGDTDQVFKLVRPPILPDLEIEVQEAGDQTNPTGETWVRWERVTSLRNCGPHSRCFVLDAVTGEISFGDGERGMVPPAGHNNIRAKRYRTHSGTAGNLPAGTITILRNPKDALNDIRLVTNVGPAAGGSGLEETSEVMQRAPYALKNRQRAVAREDFEWLARDVDGARRAFCLPTRKRDGTTQAGWVTVVVVPDQVNAEPGSNGRPIPSPQLLQDVRSYLEQRSLTNLVRPATSPAAGQLASSVPDLDQVHVSRPGFVEVRVVAQVMPENFAQADNIRNAILDQLREFLDPLQGGPDRQGWEPGRDVYISEIAAEIERVPGVDALASVSLQTPARQQQLLHIAPGVNLTHDMPAGSQVSTFDERIKLILGGSLPKDEPPPQLVTHGLNVGDPILIAASDGVTSYAARIASQLNDLYEITFDHPVEFVDEASYNQWLTELGPAPGLAFPEQHFWLALPALGQNAQFHTTSNAGKIVLNGVTVMGLKAEDPLAVGCEAGIVGAAGAQPLRKRRVSSWSGNCFWIVFDLPVDFENNEAFLDWQQQLGESSSLVSSDRRIQLPITGLDWAIDTMGRVHVLGVMARGLSADEPVSLTHATYHHRRIDFLPIETVTPWVDQQRVFVPADYLVCSADHDITMVAEATHASQAAQPG